MSPPPLPPHTNARIEYQGPGIGARPRRPIVDVPLLVTGLLFIAVVSVLTLIVTPRLESVFRDFGVTLPALSVSVLHFARLCQRGALPVLCALLLAPAFLVPLLRPWPPDDPGARHSRLARIVVILILALFTAWLVLGLFAPYVSIIDAAAGGSSKK
jgi:type II secretory pathway component PulF